MYNATKLKWHFSTMAHCIRDSTVPILGVSSIVYAYGLPCSAERSYILFNAGMILHLHASLEDELKSTMNVW